MPTPNTAETHQHDHRLTAAFEALEALGAMNDPFLTLTALAGPNSTDPDYMDPLAETHPCEETDYLVGLWTGERW